MSNMTHNERVELEVCIDILNSLIGDFYIIASRHSIPLDNSNKVGTYYRNMVKYAHRLRRSTSYEDVLDAKRNIAVLKKKLTELDVCRKEHN